MRTSTWLVASQLGDGERAGSARLIDLDRVLNRPDGLDVLGIAGVDKNPNRREGVARADSVLGQGGRARSVNDLDGVCVLVDDLQRQKALARVGEGDRDRPGVEIEHRRGIERVPVHPRHALMVEGDRIAAMDELAQAPLFHDSGEMEIGFGAREIFRGDGDRRPGRRMDVRRGRRGCRGGEQQGEFHRRLRRKVSSASGPVNVSLRRSAGNRHLMRAAGDPRRRRPRCDALRCRSPAIDRSPRRSRHRKRVPAPPFVAH